MSATTTVPPARQTSDVLVPAADPARAGVADGDGVEPAVPAGRLPPLARRVADCLPAGSPAILALMRLLRVVETGRVPTAAVECRGRPRLLLNPAFVAARCRTPEALLMLVLHELHHVLLGHTRLFPRATRVDNLVFDAVINAMLCRTHPTPAHHALLTGMYRDDRFPECLLRPPAGWAPPEVRPDGLPARSAPVALPPALADPRLWPAANAYRALYSEVGAGYHEVYDALRRLVDEEQALAVVLLGRHPGEAEGKGDGDADDPAADDLSPVVLKAVREALAEWPRPPRLAGGRSLAEWLVEESVRPLVRRTNRPILRALFRRVAGDAGASGLRRAVREHPLGVQTPVPGFDRRSVVQRALGAAPLLYAGDVARRRTRPAGERVHVYLDVSGSVMNLVPALYGAVLDCAALVHPVVHLFSTEVADVPLHRLRAGVCRTTGGTSIRCVAEHLLAHRVRRAVLITDGEVGPLSPAQLRDLRGLRLGVALTPGWGRRADLEPVATHWAQLVQPQ